MMKIYGGTRRMKRRLVTSMIENALFCAGFYGALRFTFAMMQLLGLN